MVRRPFRSFSHGTVGGSEWLPWTAQPVMAAGLGIPLDGFIGTFETFVTGLGLVVGLVGLTGYVGSLVRCESAL